MSGPVYVGIDVGSSATKCIVVDERRSLIGHHVVPSGFDYARAAEDVLRHALAMAGAATGDIAACVATGYGRERVAFADRLWYGVPAGGNSGCDAGKMPAPHRAGKMPAPHRAGKMPAVQGHAGPRVCRLVTEITCHARGAREWYPSVRTIIDIGGQDTKVIRLSEDGRLADYRMNAKCAAGTGTFLESIAHKLGLTMAALDELAMASKEHAVVNSYCTVFAGTEVIERIKEGQPREDISMGLFRSIATRVSEMMAARDGAIAATGGVAAHCRALIRALEEVLATSISLPPMPQHAGAFGAALLAAEGAHSHGSPADHVA